MLKFNTANAKLIKLQKKTGRKVYSMSTLSGHSCIGASECLAMAIKTKFGLRIKDGPLTKFRCYSASQEAQYPNVYESRKKNLDQIKAHSKNKEKLVSLILKSLPKDSSIIRWHVAGDWNTLKHFEAAIEVAKQRPNILFYSYTKSLPFLVLHKDKLPPNFKVIASKGGKWDYLIEKHKLRHAVVVFSTEQAKKLKLKIDYDDSVAALENCNFALMIHGTQPANSEAGKAVSKINRGIAV